MLEGTDVREPILMIWAADVADAYVPMGNLDEARRTIEILARQEGSDPSAISRRSPREGAGLAR